MKLFKIITILALLFFIFSSCDDKMEVNKSENCRLTKYRNVFTVDFSDFGSQKINNLIYNKEKLNSRITHYSGGVILKDSIVYDNLGRVDKVIYVKTTDQLIGFGYEEYFYEGSKKTPIKRVELRDYGSGLVKIKEEVFWFNSFGQLEKTTLMNFKRDGKKSTKEISNYIYNIQNNLIELKIEYFTTWGEIDETDFIIFSNYDDKKNPYFGLPFLNLRHLSFSSNNCKSIKGEKKNRFGDVISSFTKDGFLSEGYLYNEHGYPITDENRWGFLAEYDCNQF